jgi:hypothetical protein
MKQSSSNPVKTLGGIVVHAIWGRQDLTAPLLIQQAWTAPAQPRHYLLLQQQSTDIESVKAWKQQGM